jgi:hypothetical protein
VAGLPVLICVRWEKEPDNKSICRETLVLSSQEDSRVPSLLKALVAVPARIEMLFNNPF